MAVTRRNALAGLAFVGLLAACASQSIARRRADLDPLVGQAEVDVVRRMGIPTKRFETDGHTFLSYVEQRTDLTPGWYGSPPWWGPFAGGGGFPPQVVVYSCETTFELVAGKVIGYTLRGNAC